MDRNTERYENSWGHIEPTLKWPEWKQWLLEGMAVGYEKELHIQNKKRLRIFSAWYWTEGVTVEWQAYQQLLLSKLTELY